MRLTDLPARPWRRYLLAPALLALLVSPFARCDRSRGGGEGAAEAASLPAVSDDAAVRAWLDGMLPLGEPPARETGGAHHRGPEPGSARTPELPRATVDTKAPAPVPGGRTVRASDGGGLQAALDRARPGDVIALSPGVTYTGNFVLRPRGGGAGWVTIRTELPAGAAPAPGTRVTPASARGFARIVTPNAGPALLAAPGSHHFRIERVEITAAPGVKQMTGLVRLGDNSAAQSRPAQVPHHLVLDRVYVHGTPTLDLRRCVELNSAATAVVDSHVAECHARGADSQALWGSNGPGPFTIENNRLEGAGENVMFGGDDSRSAALVPADIVFRRNHVVKPMGWKGKWCAKNLLELKVGRRVLIEGNVLENSWRDCQDGYAVVLWTVNQGGGAPWSETADVTVRLNRIQHAGNGFQLSARSANPAVPMARVLLEHNLVTAIGTDPVYGGSGRVFQIDGNVADLRLSHNTTVRVTGPWIYFVTQPATKLDRLAIVDNVLDRGDPAMRSDYGSGGDALRLYGGPGTVMRGNVLGGWVGPLVRDNYFLPGDERLLPMAGESRGDFRLAAGSPYRGRATDGGDPGADLRAIERATAGVAPAADAP